MQQENSKVAEKNQKLNEKLKVSKLTIKDLKKKLNNQEKMLENRDKMNSELLDVKLVNEDYENQLKKYQQETNIYKKQAR